ncbi:MAG: hypothetical protein CM1200mP2_54570 [Planctomycetaceae bacterium]|nr:MAG: hypothetical protein CM1200mP2_54570 [Planctomycetaceae bacterium]
MIGMIEAGVVELAPLENLVEAVGQILLGLKQILTVLATEVFRRRYCPSWCGPVLAVRRRLDAAETDYSQGGVVGRGPGRRGDGDHLATGRTGGRSRSRSQVNGYIEKMVYVTALFTVMFVCGAIQLTGCCARCCPAPVTEPDAGHDH